MKFYIISMLLAFIQASVMTGLFVSNLYVPDLVLLYLFLHTSKQEKVDVKKPLISGLYLDLMYDTLGWNISGKLLVSLLLEIFKSRWEFATRLSLMIFYSFVALLEHLFRYILFRLKYYYPFDLRTFSLGFFLELFLLYLLTLFIIKKNAQA
jgi:rod shape-determining protein MreD